MAVEVFVSGFWCKDLSYLFVFFLRLCTFCMHCPRDFYDVEIIDHVFFSGTRFAVHTLQYP